MCHEEHQNMLYYPLHLVCTINVFHQSASSFFRKFFSSSSSKEKEKCEDDTINSLKNQRCIACASVGFFSCQLVALLIITLARGIAIEEGS